jgi:hypothetical protein
MKTAFRSALRALCLVLASLLGVPLFVVAALGAVPLAAVVGLAVAAAKLGKVGR